MRLLSWSQIDVLDWVVTGQDRPIAQTAVWPSGLCTRRINSFPSHWRRARRKAARVLHTSPADQRPKLDDRVTVHELTRAADLVLSH
jgi:hypothetical protein